MAKNRIELAVSESLGRELSELPVRSLIAISLANCERLRHLHHAYRQRSEALGEVRLLNEPDLTRVLDVGWVYLLECEQLDRWAFLLESKQLDLPPFGIGDDVEKEGPVEFETLWDELASFAIKCQAYSVVNSVLMRFQRLHFYGLLQGGLNSVARIEKFAGDGFFKVVAENWTTPEEDEEMALKNDVLCVTGKPETAWLVELRDAWRNRQIAYELME